MDFINPAVTSGVDLFINIVVILIAFVGAISLIDFKKESSKEKKEQ
jgi:nucleoside permease NupC